MSRFIKFYFTSSMLNMFWTLIHPSSGACDFSIVSPQWLLKTSIFTEHTTNVVIQVVIEKSQAPDDGCVNVRNMLSIEEVKQNLINCDIKSVSYSSIINCAFVKCQSPVLLVIKSTIIKISLSNNEIECDISTNCV